MSKFALIFRGGDAPGSPEEMQRLTQRWMAWFQGLARDGVYHDVGEPLEPGGKVIRGARKAVSDGPYAEAKDLVGGFAIVDARDLDAAAEIAKGCPIYDGNGLVEVRPVRPMAADRLQRAS
jgi:hypothetical protein